MMHFRKRHVILVLLGMLLIAGLGITYDVRVIRSPSTATPISITVSSTGSSDPSAIRDVIIGSYAVRTAALKSGDVSQYPMVFIDDPATPLDTEHADFVRKVRDRYGNAAQPINGNGWLAYESAQILDRQQNLVPLQHLQATAKAQGRALTADELRSVTQVNGNVPAPAIVDHPQQLTLATVAITTNGADVTFDDGAVMYHAVLVSTPDGWRIASEDILKVHF